MNKATFSFVIIAVLFCVFINVDAFSSKYPKVPFPFEKTQKRMQQTESYQISSINLVIFFFLEYGRQCIKDINCLSSEECFIDEKPCQSGDILNKDCGKFPNCRKLANPPPKSTDGNPHYFFLQTSQLLILLT